MVDWMRTEEEWRSFGCDIVMLSYRVWMMMRRGGGGAEEEERRRWRDLSRGREKVDL